MLGPNLDYLVRIGPPSIIIEFVLSNESNGTRISKFHGKIIPANGEEVGHP